MSFPIGVKQEALEVPPDDFNVATDESENEEDVSIDIDSLQLLDSKIASKCKFPVGCIVWFDARKSKITNVLRARSGTVVGVYFDFHCMRHVYRVKSSSDCHHTVFEDRLMYGINCTVKVTNLDTNEASNGIITFAKMEQSNGGKQLISYAVQFTEGKHVSVEFPVASDRIKYRREETSESAGMEAEMEDKDEVNQTERCDTDMKVSKSDKNVDEKKVAHTASNESKEDAVSDEGREKLNRQVAVKSKNAVNKQPAKTEVQSKRNAENHAATSTSTVRIDNEDTEMQSGTLGIARWQPLVQDESQRGEGGHECEEGLSSHERKRSLELELNSEACSKVSERPCKMIKAENAERKGSSSVLWCMLTIPKWLSHMRGRTKDVLFRHLIGVKQGGKKDGYKIEQIKAISNCHIRISGHDSGNLNFPIKIEIMSISIPNVAQGIKMVEESLTEFLSDKNAEKKLLYELMSSAEGSHDVTKHLLIRDDQYRMLHREYDQTKSWSILFDLPYKQREEGREYHGKFLTKSLKALPGGCKIELFGDTFGTPLEHTSPFVLIRGAKLRDVRAVGTMVWSAMKRHQGKGCSCVPKW